jgi:hypothetical protein
LPGRTSDSEMVDEDCSAPSMAFSFPLPRCEKPPFPSACY